LLKTIEAGFGIILAQLKELNLDKKTVVLFSLHISGLSSEGGFLTANLPYEWKKRLETRRRYKSALPMLYTRGIKERK
jgi:hypothetical protein